MNELKFETVIISLFIFLANITSTFNAFKHKITQVSFKIHFVR